MLLVETARNLFGQSWQYDQSIKV